MKQFTVVPVSYTVPTYRYVETSVTQCERYIRRVRLTSVDLVIIIDNNEGTY